MTNANYIANRINLAERTREWTKADHMKALVFHLDEINNLNPTALGSHWETPEVIKARKQRDQHIEKAAFHRAQLTQKTKNFAK